MSNYQEIIKQKLIERGYNISDCTLQTVYADSGSVGKENALIFPLKVCENMIVSAQSGCIFVKNTTDIISLIQIPLLFGTAKIHFPLPEKIPFLLIQKSN